MSFFIPDLAKASTAERINRKSPPAVHRQPCHAATRRRNLHQAVGLEFDATHSAGERRAPGQTSKVGWRRRRTAWHGGSPMLTMLLHGGVGRAGRDPLFRRHQLGTGPRQGISGMVNWASKPCPISRTYDPRASRWSSIIRILRSFRRLLPTTIGHRRLGKLRRGRHLRTAASRSKHPGLETALTELPGRAVLITRLDDDTMPLKHCSMSFFENISSDGIQFFKGCGQRFR